MADTIGFGAEMSIEALSMVLNHSHSVGSAKVVLLGIANHLGPDANEGAWPTQQRLAAYANMTERGVQKCIEKLVELGELTVEVAAGNSQNKYKPNRYWINVECPDDCDRSMSHRRGEHPYREGRTPVPLGTNTRTPRDELEFVQTVIEPTNNRNNNQDLFDQFWSVYPRKQAKAAARKAFAKAIRKVNFDHLLKAVQAYTDDPNREPQFTVQASRWLNEERWTDEPLPRRGESRAIRQNEVATFAANFQPIRNELDSPHATGEIES
jgi:hypothetical protein